MRANSSAAARRTSRARAWMQSDQAWGDISSFATIPRDCISSAGGTPMAAASGSILRAIRSLTKSSSVYAITDRRRHDRIAVLTAPVRHAARPIARDCPFHFQRPALSRVFRAIRWPRRCSRTACSWSDAASNCIGRAGFIQLRRRGTQRACGFGIRRHAHAQLRATPAGTARRPGRRKRQLLAQRRISTWARSTVGSPRCCPPAFITRPSNGPIGMCSSPAFGAWRDSAAPPREPDPDRYEEIAAQRGCAGHRRRARGTCGRRRRGAERARTSCCSSGSRTSAVRWAVASRCAQGGADRGSASAAAFGILTRTLAFGVYDHNLGVRARDLSARTPSRAAMRRRRAARTAVEDPRACSHRRRRRVRAAR